MARRVVRKRRGELISGIRRVLGKCGKMKNAENDMMMKKYLTHCATMIQSNWRGWLVRNKVIPEIFKFMQIAEKILAFVRGWKTRRTLQTS